MSAATIDVVTPEGVPIRVPLAGLGERFVALLLDLFIIIAGLIAVSLAVTAVGAIAFSADVDLLNELGALMLLAVFLIRHGYFVFFETRWHGTTPGKRLLNLRVVSRDGAGLSGEAVVARNLLRDVELFLPLVALIAPDALVGPSPAWLWLPAITWVFVVSALPWMNREKARAGDLVAGTVVVRVPRAALHVDEAEAVSQRSPAMAGARTRIHFTDAQLAIYGEHELETLADLLRRTDSTAVDWTDLQLVARTIAHKIGYAGPEPQSDTLRFLRAFYRAQRAALEKRLLYGKRKRSKFDREG